MNSIKTHWHSSFHGFKKGSQTRWTITLSTCGTIIGKLLGMAGLSNLEEASQESKPYRIIRDTRDVEEVITALRSTMGGDGCHLRVVPPGQLHRRPSTPKRFINIVFFSRNYIWV